MTDLAGTYRILEVRTAEIGGASHLIQSFQTRKDVSVKLNSDHTAVVSNIPQFDGFGEKLICSFSGPAKWELWDDGTWVIRFDADFPAGSPEAKTVECGLQWNDGMSILGQSAPHRFWLGIGDPDSDTGIEFELEAHSH